MKTTDNYKNNTSAIKEVIESFNTPVFPLKRLTPSVKGNLEIWQKTRLLEKHEINPLELSHISILWIATIEELRSFGFGKDKIKNVKDQLFNNKVFIEKGVSTTLFESLVLDALGGNEPTFIVVYSNGNIDIYNDLSYFDFLKCGKLKNHLLLNINGLIKDNIEPIYSSPEFRTVQLSSAEKQVIETVRKDEFVSIIVDKDRTGKKIDLIKGEEKTLTYSLKELDTVLRKGRHQELKVVQTDGNTVLAKKTKKIKPE